MQALRQRRSASWTHSAIQTLAVQRGLRGSRQDDKEAEDSWRTDTDSDADPDNDSGTDSDADTDSVNDPYDPATRALPRFVRESRAGWRDRQLAAHFSRPGRPQYLQSGLLRRSCLSRVL